MKSSALALALVAATAVVAVNAQGRRLAQATCTAASGATGNETAYNVVPMTGGNGTLCFNVTVGSACDATKDCCPAGATEMPRFDSLILEPPSNSSCASKGLRRCIKWTVGDARPRRGRADGATMTVRISKLDPASGGTVCVDLSGTKDANCQAVQDLCASETSCSVALQTKKHKKAKGGPAVGCCSAAYVVPPPPFCVDQSNGTACTADDGKAGTCQAGECVVPPPPFCADQPDGTHCTTDSGGQGLCQAGSCAEWVNPCLYEGSFLAPCTTYYGEPGWCEPSSLLGSECARSPCAGEPDGAYCWHWVVGQGVCQGQYCIYVDPCPDGAPCTDPFTGCPGNYYGCYCFSYTDEC